MTKRRNNKSSSGFHQIVNSILKGVADSVEDKKKGIYKSQKVCGMVIDKDFNELVEKQKLMIFGYDPTMTDDLINGETLQFNHELPQVFHLPPLPHFLESCNSTCAHTPPRDPDALHTIGRKITNFLLNEDEGYLDEEYFGGNVVGTNVYTYDALSHLNTGSDNPKGHSMIRREDVYKNLVEHLGPYNMVRTGKFLPEEMDMGDEDWGEMTMHAVEDKLPLLGRLYGKYMYKELGLVDRTNLHQANWSRVRGGLELELERGRGMKTEREEGIPKWALERADLERALERAGKELAGKERVGKERKLERAYYDSDMEIAGLEQARVKWLDMELAGPKQVKWPDMELAGLEQAKWLVPLQWAGKKHARAKWLKSDGTWMYSIGHNGLGQSPFDYIPGNSAAGFDIHVRMKRIIISILRGLKPAHSVGLYRELPHLPNFTDSKLFKVKDDALEDHLHKRFREPIRHLLGYHNRDFGFDVSSDAVDTSVESATQFIRECVIKVSELRNHQRIIDEEIEGVTNQCENDIRNATLTQIIKNEQIYKHKLEDIQQELKDGDDSATIFRSIYKKIESAQKDHDEIMMDIELVLKMYDRNKGVKSISINESYIQKYRSIETGLKDEFNNYYPYVEQYKRSEFFNIYLNKYRSLADYTINQALHCMSSDGKVIMNLDDYLVDSNMMPIEASENNIHTDELAVQSKKGSVAIPVVVGTDVYLLLDKIRISTTNQKIGK